MEGSQELVMGIVRTVGSDCEAVFDYIDNNLRELGYESHRIKVSTLILGQFADRAEGDFKGTDDRTNYYMDLGNQIRHDTGDCSILMKGVAAYINQHVRKGTDQPLDKVAVIIDSVKRPEEVAFLRNLYGDGFHLLGITCNRETRLKHLERKGLNRNQATRLVNRDEKEADDSGQCTREVYQEADYFIDASSDEALIKASIERLFKLLFGHAFITPTFDEYAMFRAFVASLRSADMSRQVGAVIAQQEEIISEGVNDCPKFHGGLYWPEFYEPDERYRDIPGGRDHTLGLDMNKIQQDILAKSILGKLGEEWHHDEWGDSDVELVKSAGLDRLTEYGRVVHAEMEAMLMCARNRMSTRGCTMYVTTFPCHNCAKHIIAAGIAKVVYIEPYPKSLARDLYKNEIDDILNEAGDKGKENLSERVKFVPFYGVGPHRFVDLFSMKSTRWKTRVRKDSAGRKIEWNNADARLRTPMMPITYLDAEMNAYVEYNESVKAWKGAGNGER